jgi:hypothetical protein
MGVVVGVVVVSMVMVVVVTWGQVGMPGVTGVFERVVIVVSAGLSSLLMAPLSRGLMWLLLLLPLPLSVSSGLLVLSWSWLLLLSPVPVLLLLLLPLPLSISSGLLLPSGSWPLLPSPVLVLVLVPVLVLLLVSLLVSSSVSLCLVSFCVPLDPVAVAAATSARRRRVDAGFDEMVGVVSGVVLARSGGATAMPLASRIARFLFLKKL